MQRNLQGEKVSGPFKLDQEGLLSFLEAVSLLFCCLKVWVFCLFVCLYTTCMSIASGVQKRALAPLKRKLDFFELPCGC